MGGVKTCTTGEAGGRKGVWLSRWFNSTHPNTATIVVIFFIDRILKLIIKLFRFRRDAR
jgi:hypothetical protein